MGLLACAALVVLVFPARVRTASVPREVLAFFYGWYGTPEGSGGWRHWQGVDPHARRIADATHYPAGGAYDSLDASVIRRQSDQMRQAGLTGLIVSWWGRGTFEDRALDLVAAAAPQEGLKVSAYYETLPAGTEGAPFAARVDAALADITYLLDRHGHGPTWLRVEGRPVLFIYARAIRQLGPDGWRQVIGRLSARPDAPLLIGDLGGAGSLHEMRVFAGVHSYNDAAGAAGMDAGQIGRWASRTFGTQLRPWAGKIRCATLFPGFDNRGATGDPDPGGVTPRNNGRTLAETGRAAMASRPDWLLVTSWNEWHEGTEVEPSVEHGTAALAELRHVSDRFLALPPRAVPLPPVETRPGASVSS